MDAAEFRAAGHALVDQLAHLLASVPSGPVTRGESPAEVRSALGLDADLPEHGTAAGPLLEETARRLFEHSLFTRRPPLFRLNTAAPASLRTRREPRAA